MTDPVSKRAAFDRSTVLAADRTILARERTYAAWVRTGLAALAAAVASRAYLSGVVPHWLAVGTAALLALFSGFCFIGGIWRELSPGFVEMHPDDRALPPGLLIAMNGMLALIALATFGGIVFLR